MGSVVKIAVLSDIHGNLPALQAVLEDIRAVDAVLCCGDLVGYYPDINETCTVMRKLNVSLVRGNHDAFVSGFLEPDPAKATAYRTEWAKAHLEAEHLQWLRSLPVELRCEWDGMVIRLRHANPWDEVTYIYPDSDLTGIQLEKDEILILGHTHYPMLARAGDGEILNPGSVGQPRDGNPHASYAILDTRTRHIDIIRKPYDVRGLQKRLAAMGWGDIARILSREKE